MILVVDDHQTIASNIVEYLNASGLSAIARFDGEAAFDLLKSENAIPHSETQSSITNQEPIELVVLDRMMPKIDGLSLVRMMRANKIMIPVIFLTALTKPVDRLEGLELGAIDYINKPVELKELTLKIKNVLGLKTELLQGASLWYGKKREISNQDENTKTIAQDQEDSAHGILRVDDVEIHWKSQLVKKNGKTISLSPKEYQLLLYLAENQGTMVSVEQILEHVWHESEELESRFRGTITVHIAYLRKKLGSKLIRTVKLSGYTIDG